MERPEGFDVVEKPRHYNSHPSGLEAIDLCEHMPFNVGNAVKYLWRAGLKGDDVEDLKKALWYIKRERERIQLFDQEPVIEMGSDAPTHIIYRILSRKIIGADPASVLARILGKDISVWEDVVTQEITLRQARAKDQVGG